MRANRGIPHYLEGEGKRLKKRSQCSGGKVMYWCKCGRIRLVQMTSVIHEATIANTGRKDRKTNMEIKKLYAVVQYNKFMKGIDRADQYMSYYSVLKKTVKWSKKLLLYVLNCVLFNAFFVYRTLNTNKV